MTQTNFIVGALVVGFFVFITVRGELPDYIRLFTLKRKEVTPDSGGGFLEQMLGDDPEGWLNTAVEVARVYSGDYAAAMQDV